MTDLAQARKGGPPRKKREADRDWYDVVAGYAGTVAKICMALFVVCLGYIIYAVYGGYLSGDVDPRKLDNIRLVGRALAGAGLIGTIALALATLGEVAYVVAAAVVGLGLIFGTPVLILSKLQQPESPAGLAIQEWTRNAGFAICAVAILRVIYYVIETIRTGPRSRVEAQKEEDERLGPKKVRRTQGVWSKCWALPYCHETIRDVCPAYKERRNCWKFGRGCNCDPTLVETMIRSGAARVGKGQDKISAQKQTTQDEYLRDALGGGSSSGPSQDRTIDCKKCPIYGEHQRQKFNIANPIAIILTIASLVVSYPYLKYAYTATIHGLAAFAARFTLTEDINPDRWFNYLDTVAVQIFFFGILSLFILSYILKLVEWAVFVKKW